MSEKKPLPDELLREFRQIPEYPDYEISREGCVRNINTKRIFKHYIGTLGYCIVPLKLNGKYQNKRLHRLLATAFIPNPDDMPIINHINGVKSDNRLENLEWCTQSENLTHALRTGLRSNRGEKNSQSKLTKQDICKIRALLSEGVSYPKIANLFNVSRSNIGLIKLGKGWNHV